MTTKDFPSAPTITYRIDSGAWQALSAPYQFTLDPATLTAGKHRMTVRAETGDISENRSVNFYVRGTVTTPAVGTSTPVRWKTTESGGGGEQ